MKENITLNNDLHIQNDSAPSLTQGKTLYISPDAEEFNYKGILGKVIQYVNMADIVGKIQVGAKYVVQIPSEHMEAYLRVHSQIKIESLTEYDENYLH